MLYFASFVTVSCFELIIDFSPTLSADQNFMQTEAFFWLASDFAGRADGRAWTTPDP
ncbi:hypothetical protein BDR06DRAFT_959520 [Suillus hirtellus]|nr:hypothetical protein BDR06DRAFT_959520 [Suillus hirtellus]